MTDTLPPMPGQRLARGVARALRAMDFACVEELVPTPGLLTFPINRALLAGGVAVTDDEVKAAMRLVYETLKLVVEPGGAVSLAALLAGKIEARGQITAIVLSGGNVDPGLFSAVIEGRFEG